MQSIAIFSFESYCNSKCTFLDFGLASCPLFDTKLFRFDELRNFMVAFFVNQPFKASKNLLHIL